MNDDYLDDLSIALINQAEHDCAAQDPGMTDAAAMVLVGDVYALHLCCRQRSPAKATQAGVPRNENEELSPFIR